MANLQKTASIELRRFFIPPVTERCSCYLCFPYIRRFRQCQLEVSTISPDSSRDSDGWPIVEPQECTAPGYATSNVLVILTVSICKRKAFALRELDVESVPLNFLNPVRGTPAGGYTLVPPLEILKMIALFRFVLPARDIRVCGGREAGLRTLQPLMYLAGANPTMAGSYLTTGGRNPDVDLQEIRDLALEVLPPRDEVRTGP